jgi:integrase
LCHGNRFTDQAAGRDLAELFMPQTSNCVRLFLMVMYYLSSVHAHMLWHAFGYALANAGHDTRRIQDWLGHRSIQHTTRYTQLSATPFNDFRR